MIVHGGVDSDFVSGYWRDEPVSKAITLNQEVAMRHISIKDSWEDLIEELKKQWDNHPEKEIVEHTIRIKLHEGLIEQHRNMRDTQTSLLEQQMISNRAAKQLMKQQDKLAKHQKKVTWATGALALFTLLLVGVTVAYTGITWMTLGSSKEQITSIKDLVTASRRQATALDVQAAALGKQIGALNTLKASIDPVTPSVQDLALSFKMLPVEADKILRLTQVKESKEREKAFQEYEQKKEIIRQEHYQNINKKPADPF
jgi:hypothetical protein